MRSVLDIVENIVERGENKYFYNYKNDFKGLFSYSN